MINPIKAYRDKAGLTQEGLADLVGSKKALVCKWEKGVPPSPMKAIALEEISKGEIPKWVTRPDLWDAPQYPFRPEEEAAQAPTTHGVAQ